MLAEEDRGAIRAACGAVLSENWREGLRRDGVRFAYTCPSPRHYPWQWYWDSCFTAIAWRHFDAARPARELGSLLAAQREDGFIGHTIFWNTPLRFPRTRTYNVLSRDAPMTASIQPPALAWAWRIAVGDPASEPAIAAHHDWLERHRTFAADGDGLLWIVQPDESGLDAAPMFDATWTSRTHGRPGFVRLVHRNRALGFDLLRIDAAGGPVCCEVLTNVLYSLARVAIGRPSLTQALIDRCYDERTGVFVPVSRPAPPVATAAGWASLAPLALPDLPEAIGRRLVDEHVLNPAGYWLPFPLPSVPADDPSFSCRERVGLLRQRRYWRGPTWINSAWLVWLGLIRLGYRAQADELTRRLAGAVRAGGLHEYYDPYTGTGMGQPGFAWSALIMELIAQDPRATRSYL